MEDPIVASLCVVVANSTVPFLHVAFDNPTATSFRVIVTTLPIHHVVSFLLLSTLSSSSMCLPKSNHHVVSSSNLADVV
ncbi:hypothetical protein Csa_018400 [Cucumis sativus]|uniref:Uncharacterized protein n=1 Tax=Cucumis sativus TaxID=3659 RepID=A0A0A0KPQ9_CUCSA|nr:hypothetical protein Csa_018400 [Cucumis sativus]